MILFSAFAFLVFVTGKELLSEQGYYTIIPIQYNQHDYPTIEVQIEGRSYVFIVEIGCTSTAFLDTETLDTMNVTFDSLRVWKNTDDYQSYTYYETPAYRIPRVKVGSLNIESLLAIETPVEGDNVIGQGLGMNYNVLLDLPNNRMIACDNFDRLCKQNIATKDWVRIPFFYDALGMFIQGETDWGCSTFELSTTQQQSLLFFPATQREQKNISTIRIKGHDFGRLSFVQIPQIQDHHSCLGLDFLRKNSLYIDFTNQCLYMKVLISQEK
ncbi:MAG: hypothetical protein FJZ58_04915 [Chlamydiae bacterium]|nr:hypothetical protein [Chlamydiota bacterium]